MSFDPRAEVKTLLDTVSVTVDGGGAATLLVMYTGGWENLKQLFLVDLYDAILAVDPATKVMAAPDRRIQDVPLRYNADVPVHVLAINTAIVTATTILEKIRVDIRDVIEADPQKSEYTVFISRVQSANRPQGGYDPLWQDDYVFYIRPVVGG